MRQNLAVTARFLFVSAAVLPLAAPLHGASPGFPFAEDFQSQPLLSTQTTARWTSGSVTLDRARHLQLKNLDLAPRNSRIGNSRANTAINDIAVRDMDGDGNMDVITAGAGGVFVYYVDDDDKDNLESIEPVRITSEVLFRTMSIGDFDRDGWLDVAAAGDSRAVLLFMNDEGKRSVFMERNRRVSNLRVIALASEDMNGDGALDLVLLQRKASSVEVHLNDGAGNFSLRENAVSTTSGDNKALGVGDFNGDRRMDIVLAKTGQVNVFHLGDGSGGFGEARLLSPPATGVDYRGIAVGDVNNDGHLDIVVGVRRGQNILYLGNGNGGFSTGSRISNSASWTLDVELADLDGDGDLDLAEGVSREGHRIYLNQDGVLDSEGLPIRGRTSAIAVGDVDGDGYLGFVRGRNTAWLEVARLPERQMTAPSASLFDTGRGRVVSGEVNGGQAVPRVVFLTATAVQQEHTDIEYYLSNDGGDRWVIAHPGRSVRFPEKGNDDLRWRAELKSRSPVRTTTLTRVSIENVLQVFIDGEVFRNGQTFTATTHTIRAGVEPTTATIRLVSRGEQAIEVTGVKVIGAVFKVEEETGRGLPQTITQGVVHESRLVFNPTQRETVISTMTIFSSEGDNVEGGDILPEIKVALRGRGIGAHIDVPESVRRIEIPVGTSKSRTVEITNKGEIPLTITSATAADSAFSLTEPVTLPTTLTVANPDKDFKFRFKPEAPGTVTTTITFISNAVNGIVTRTLTGKGVAPLISVQQPGTDADESVPEIDFGEVRVNRPTSLTRVIKNTGDLPLIITGVTVENAQFALLEPVIEDVSSKTVPINSTLALTVQFNPQQRGVVESGLMIHSDAFNTAQSRVTLRGEGTAPEIAFDPNAKIIFGNVRVGQIGTDSVVVENTGDEPLIVSGVKSIMPDRSLEDVISLVSRTPQTVPAGMTGTLIFGFMPSERMEMPIGAFLTIDSNAVNMGEEPRLPVEGKGIAPVLAIAVTDTSVENPKGSTDSVASHDFGDVPINTTASRRVFISNDGDASLEVTPRLDGGTGFRWQSTPGSVIVLGLGESTSNLILHFEPEQREPDTASLIFSDTLNNLHTTYTLTGRGTEVGMEVRVNGSPLAAGGLRHLGEIRMDKTTTVVVEVVNNGNANLDIDALWLEGDDNYSSGDTTATGTVEGSDMPSEPNSRRFDRTFKLGAAGLATATLTIRSNDPQTATYRATLTVTGTAPVIVVRVDGEERESGGSPYDFGGVLFDEAATREVVIHNDGDAPLDVTSVAAGPEESGFKVFRTPRVAPVVIDAGSSKSWSLSFEPPGEGVTASSGVLDIVSDDPVMRHWHLDLRGTGAHSEIGVEMGGRLVGSGGDYDFGEVGIIGSAEVAVIVSNTGSGLLRVKPPVVSGAAYSLVNDRGEDIPPGSSHTWVVRFAPRDITAPHTGTLIISSNDLDEGVYKVNLAGRGLDSRMEVFLEEDGVRRQYRNGEWHYLNDAVIGKAINLFIYLSNTGASPLEVSDLRVSGEGFRVEKELAALPNPGVVGPGVSAAYVGVLKFEPVRQGPHAGTLVIHSNDISSNEFTIRLRVNDVRPGVDIRIDGLSVNSGEDSFKSEYDFGEVLVGDSLAVEVDVTSGTYVKDIYFLDNKGGQFDFTPPFYRYVVQSSTSPTFSLLFTPMETGFATAVLAFQEFPLDRVFTLTLRGRGVAPRMSVEVAGQTTESAVGSHDFGMVPAGMERATTVTVSNNGGGNLNIESIRVAGAGYRLGGDESGTIAAGSSANWTVHFTPPGDAPSYRGVLTIVSNDRESGPQGVRTLELNGGAQDAINRAGTGTEPQMAVAIEPRDWSEVALATTEDISVSVSNTGEVELDISSIKVTGDGYSLVNGDAPQTVLPGSTTTFSLRFAPTLPQPHTGTLSIVSDDPRQPVWTTSVTGYGVGPRVALWFDGRLYTKNNELYRYYDATDKYRRLGVVNEGNAILTVTDLRVQGDHLLLRRNHPGQYRQGRHFLSDRGVFQYGGNSRFLAKSRYGVLIVISDDPAHPVFRLRLQNDYFAPPLEVRIGGRLSPPDIEYNFGDAPVDKSIEQIVHLRNTSGGELSLYSVTTGGSAQFKISSLPDIPTTLPRGASSTFNLSFAPVVSGTATARLALSYHHSSTQYYSASTGYHAVILRGNGISATTPTSAPANWAGGAQNPAVPTFTALEAADAGAPRFVGLGYADRQSRLWLAFDEPVQILSGTDSTALADGALLSGFEVLPNYDGGDGGEDIGVLRARYRSGGVVMELARNIVPADASVWVRYTPPSDSVSGIYDMAVPPNRISTTRLFMLPRSAVLDYDGDGFPDALEARLGGNPLVADDAVGLPEVALLRAGAAGSPAAVAYSGIRADGVAAHLGVVTTGASNLAAYYLSDTFGYSGGYALGVDGYGCTGRFPADYASPLFGGGCAVVDFNNSRAGVEHRIGWLATNDAGYWAVAQGTASRLPEMVILRVPEFNMKRRNVFVSNSAAADETVVVGAFHDGPASSQSLTVSLSNVVAADSPSSKEPDGFSLSVAGGAPNAAPDTAPDGVADATAGAATGATTSATPDITSYAITGVHSGEAGKLWLAGDPLSLLTPDKYSLGKVTQTDVVRLPDDNLPPLFGRASLYEGTTAGVNERHAVVVRGTENYIALLPVVQGSVQTASAFEVSPWDGAGGGPVAVDDRILAVNAASPVADGALVRIAFTASNPPATVRNTVSLEVAASSAGASTATTVLTWPVIDSADALASIAGDGDNDGIPDVRDSYHLLNRLPISVAGGVSGYPDRSSAGADGWHHIRPLLPLHNQFAGSYATRAGLQFHTGFNGDPRILARLPVATSGEQAIAAPKGQTPLAAYYQPGIPIQVNYADFAASLSRDEFGAMARQSRQDISVVYNFRLHGVEPSVAQGASLAGGRAGVVIPLPESLHEHASILPLHYTNGAWSGFSTEPDTPITAGFAPLQAGVCPDDNGLANSPYRTTNSVLNTRKRTGDACMVLYLTDGAAADRDGNINGVVDALIGLATTTLPR